jgi:hypothetical protein
LQYALQTILEAHDNSTFVPPESSEDVVEEETPKRMNHLPTSLVTSRTVFSKKILKLSTPTTQEAKQNKPSPEASNNVFPKQSKQDEIKQSLGSPCFRIRFN